MKNRPKYRKMVILNLLVELTWNRRGSIVNEFSKKKLKLWIEKDVVLYIKEKIKWQIK